MTLGHIHGRFQPFHHEHLDYADWAAAHCDELIIGITNADPSHITPEDADPNRNNPRHNPFLYHERQQMIKAATEESAIEIPIRIMPFPINRPELWSHYVPDGAVHFVNVLEDWHEVKVERFRENERPVETKHGTRTMSGTLIRERMATDDDWEQLVPNAVVAIIDEINGAQRVSEIWD